MRRFFSENKIGDRITLTGSDVAHIRNVLRMEVGDKLLINVGGTDYACVIGALELEKIVCDIQQQLAANREPSIQVTLFQGLPKADKMELIIQKCVELGIHRIVPVACERCIVKLPEREAEKKIERWNKIAVEAAKQCGRGALPEVAMPLRVKEIKNNFDLALLLWEEEQQNGLHAVLREGVQEIAIFVGPEGGIAPAEARLLCEVGFVPITLGKRILRTETAGLASLSAIMYQYHELG